MFCNITRFLSYDKDEHGELIINEKKAELVRRIYDEYLQGKSYQKIANGLERDGIPTVTGILKNEKYCGTLLQQKTVTLDYLSYKRVKIKVFMHNIE